MAFVSKVREQEISYDVKKHIGVLSKSANGWTKEINYVAWNGGAPRYELRSWSPNRVRMGKGIALSFDELMALRAMLDQLRADEQDNA